MEEINISLNKTELFFLKDIVGKAYWTLKEHGEAEDILKIILGIENKVYKKYREINKKIIYDNPELLEKEGK